MMYVARYGRFGCLCKIIISITERGIFVSARSVGRLSHNGGFLSQQGVLAHQTGMHVDCLDTQLTPKVCK